MGWAIFRDQAISELSAFGSPVRPLMVSVILLHAVLVTAFAMVLSAVAFRGAFQLYTFVTMLVVIGFGAAASFAIQGIEQNMTPWAGAFERINAYAYFAWRVRTNRITA